MHCNTKTDGNIFLHIDLIIDRNKNTIEKVQDIQKQVMGVMRDKHELLDESLAYKKEVARLKEEVELLQKDNGKNKQFINKVQASWDALNKEITEMVKMNNFFEENIVRLKEKIEGLEGENTVLKRTDDKMSTFLNNKIVFLKERICCLEGENRQLKDEVTKLEYEEHRAHRELEMWQEHLEDALDENEKLWEKITSLIGNKPNAKPKPFPKREYFQRTSSGNWYFEAPTPTVNHAYHNLGNVYHNHVNNNENNITINVQNLNNNYYSGNAPQTSHNGMYDDLHSGAYTGKHEQHHMLSTGNNSGGGGSQIVMRDSNQIVMRDSNNDQMNGPNVQHLITSMEKMKTDFMDSMNQKARIEHEKAELCGRLYNIQDQIALLKEENTLIWKHLAHKLHK